MPTASKMKMVNGRVSERSVAKAAQVLAGCGLTVSSFIRNSIDYVARVGTVPESGFPMPEPSVDTARVRSLVRELESKPMPGKQDYPGLSEDELVEKLLMERHGY